MNNYQVLNLLTSKDNGIDYYNNSRLLTEQADGVEDRHSHMLEP